MLWWTSYRKFDSLQENATISLDLHVRLSLLFQNMEDSFPFNTPLGVFACLSWFQILNISYCKKVFTEKLNQNIHAFTVLTYI